MSDDRIIAVALFSLLARLIMRCILLIMGILITTAATAETYKVGAAVAVIANVEVTPIKGGRRNVFPGLLCNIVKSKGTLLLVEHGAEDLPDI